MRLSALHASNARLRDEHAAQQELIRILLEKQQVARQSRCNLLTSLCYHREPLPTMPILPARLHELLGNVAVVALGASSALLPTALFGKLEPFVRSTPLALSVVGVWRIVGQSVRRVADSTLRALKEFLPTDTQPSGRPINVGDPVTPAFG